MWPVAPPPAQAYAGIRVTVIDARTGLRLASAAEFAHTALPIALPIALLRNSGTTRWLPADRAGALRQPLAEQLGRAVRSALGQLGLTPPF